MPRTRSFRPGTRRSYHHGDLKAALVTHALRILKTQGPEALTLRALARAAGVSEAAPYRHFTDRRALIGAVAEQGFERLKQALVQGVKSARGRAGLKQVAVAYVRFARENPAEYRVMFGPETAHTGDLPTLRKAARGTLAFVAEGITQLQKAGIVGPGNPSLMAIATWSALHGLVMLSLDGQIDDITPSQDALVEEATRILMFGMAAR
jgi:AcrR family transcriptional regulator